MIVAVKLDVIEGCGDAVPAGHGGGFDAADMRPGEHHHVAEAERFADQHNFEFDRGTDCQLPGAEEVGTSGANVASHKGNGRFFWYPASATKAQREVQRGAGIFAVFWMDADGVRGHADKTPRLRWTQERRDAKGRDARKIRERLWSKDNFARFRGWFGRPRFEWSYALRRAHIALRDGTTGRWQRPNKQNHRTDFLDLPRPRNAVWSAKMSLEGGQRQSVENERSVLTSNT
jgi:hypothetical protein